MFHGFVEQANVCEELEIRMMKATFDIIFRGDLYASIMFAEIPLHSFILNVVSTQCEGEIHSQ